jgi:antitoxin component HigA of HigAB toxin-antitoxin module
MNARRRLGGLEFHVKRDQEGFTFHVKTDPEYQAAREEVFRLVDQAVTEARRTGVTIAEILAYLARHNRRTPPAAGQ